jgi:hypothetical protein
VLTRLHRMLRRKRQVSAIPGHSFFSLSNWKETPPSMRRSVRRLGDLVCAKQLTGREWARDLRRPIRKSRLPDSLGRADHLCPAARLLHGRPKWLLGPRGNGIVAGTQRGWEPPTGIPSYMDSSNWQAWFSGVDPPRPSSTLSQWR